MLGRVGCLSGGSDDEVGVLGVTVDPAADERAQRDDLPAPAPDVVEGGPHQGAAEAGLPGVGVDLGVGEDDRVATPLVRGDAEHALAVADLEAVGFRDVPDGGLHAARQPAVPAGVPAGTQGPGHRGDRALVVAGAGFEPATSGL